MSSEPLVLCEHRDGVAVITLNRPAQRNSLRYESWTELSQVLASCEARAIVLAGAGGFFSAGGDLKTGPAHGTGPMSPAGRVEHAQRVMEQLRAAAVPTIAAVEGAAVGLGWSPHCPATLWSRHEMPFSRRRSWRGPWCPTADWLGG